MSNNFVKVGGERYYVKSVTDPSHDSYSIKKYRRKFSPYAEDRILDLYNKGITDIDQIKGLDTLDNLEGLDLSGYTSFKNVYQIKEIKNLDCLTELRVLLLQSNLIEEIKGLEKLINLKKLNLVHNKIKEIKGLETLTNLEELDLGGNKIESTKGLETLTELRELSIWCNEDLKDIQELKHLTKLQKLWLGRSKVEDISVLEHLTNLEELHLKDTYISTIEPLRNHQKLHTLCLGWTDYLSDPEDVLMTIPNLSTIGLTFIGGDLDLDFMDECPRLREVWITCLHGYSEEGSGTVACNILERIRKEGKDNPCRGCYCSVFIDR